ncbi:MAG: hypothetical protein SVV80_13280 [Planctomycetota bacterium]|nr:hypothetical protein [Planctomycetota bacterium]
MSLINEALKRADGIGPNTETQPPRRSTHNVEHLYDEKVQTGSDPFETETEENPSRLLRGSKTSLGGAAVLGVCVISVVAVIMHFTLPQDQQSPVEAEAGLRRTQLSSGVPADVPEMQIPPSGEENRTKHEKTMEKSDIAALQQTIAEVPRQNTARTPEITTPPPEPVRVVPSAEGKQKPHVPKASDQLTLSGILASDGKRYAIINNQMVAVGDNINGVKVVGIGKYHVVLEKDGKQFTLRM